LDISGQLHAPSTLGRVTKNRSLTRYLCANLNTIISLKYMTENV